MVDVTPSMSWYIPKISTSNERIPPTSSLEVPWLGLWNGGVTCYRNALIQALVAVMQASGKPLPSPTDNVVGPNYAAIRISIHALFERLTHPADTKDVKSLHKEVRELQQSILSTAADDTSYFYRFRTGQHDVGEFLMALFTVWPSLEKLFSLSDTMTIYGDGNGHHENHATMMTSRSHSDHISILELQLSDSVQQSIDDYVAPEKVLLRNDKCGCEYDIIKTHSLDATGDAVIIALKRSTAAATNHQNGGACEYRIVKDMRFVQLDSHVTIRQRRFRLVAVVDHSGSCVSRGHYTTRAERMGSWYTFNDEHVNPCEAPGDSKSQTAVLLMYVIISE